MKTFPSDAGIELLEPRLAPAGLIAVSVNSAGTLVLGNVTGQDGNEGVTITRLTNGNYELTPSAGTMLRIGGADSAAPQTVAGVTGGLLANLGTGDDVVFLNNCSFSKGVTVNLGAGEDTYSMTNTTIGGALMVNMGDGDDVVLFGGITSAIGGAATLKLGTGVDFIFSSADRLNFSAGLTIDGGTGSDTVDLGATDGDQVRIIGNFKIVGGTGDDTLRIGAANAIFNASGTVTVTDAGGSETISITGSRFDAGALVLQVGGGNNPFVSTVTDLTLVRNFQWTSTTGNDDVDINGDTFRAGTTLQVALGTGADNGEINSTSLIYIGGSAMLSANSTAGVVRVLEIDTTGEVSIGGKLTINAGAGNGEVGLQADRSAFINGGIAITAGAGTGEIQVKSQDALVVNGAVSLIKNANAGHLTIAGAEGDCIINGAVTMRGGNNIQLAMSGVIHGAVSLATAAAAAEAPVISVQRGGGPLLQITGSLRVNAPTLASQSGSLGAVQVLVEGTANFTGGAGADGLRMNHCTFEKSLTVALGAGNDQFLIEDFEGAPDSLFRGPVLQGGAGMDNFVIGGDSVARKITFQNKVTFDGGADADSITIGSQVTYNPAYPPKQVSIP
ncbi:MAG TPA: hypothetical protein VD994_00290 [Prosthecobacter sp.]|nr:hypothetical protein [Prosthecobacter sp.]